MPSPIYIYAAAGLASGAVQVGAAHSAKLHADAQPVALRAVGKALGVAMPRLASRFAELAVIGARLCANRLAEPLPTGSALYLASGLGDVARADTLQYQVMPPRSEMASPAQFATSGNNMGAFFVAQQLGLMSRNFTISQADLSLEYALTLALDDLHHGIATHALVGGVDETTLPRDFYVRRYPLSADKMIGEGSGWLVLGTAPHGAIGEIIAATVLPVDVSGNVDWADWAGRVAAAVPMMAERLTAATLMPGGRLSAAQCAALAARWPACVVSDYRDRIGCFPTAAALAMVGTLAELPPVDTPYLHVNADAGGRIGIIVWRAYQAVVC